MRRPVRTLLVRTLDWMGDGQTSTCDALPPPRVGRWRQLERMACLASRASSPSLPSSPELATTDAPCTLQQAAAAAALLFAAAARADSDVWTQILDPEENGALFDFSFAGYWQGTVPLPSPPATRSVFDKEFARDGDSDTQAFQAALAWAHSQPVTEGSEMHMCLLQATPCAT